MRRAHQFVLVSTFLTFSWLAMQAVHELGHVLGGLASGGKISKVVLHPSTISRTDLSHNPHPLVEVWAGPTVGAILPLLVYLAAEGARCPGLYLFRFFAGFCLIANGAYVGVGPAQGLADSGVLLAHGAARWQLVLFGLVTVPLGLFLWNGLGPKFGLGDARGEVSRAAALTSLVLLIVIAGLEILIGSR